MPIYDFKCTSCGYKFDKLTTMDERANVKCPKCQSRVMRVYEGKWAIGKKAASGGCSCGGNCAGCAGCGGV